MAASPLDGTWQLLRAELAGEAAPELVTTKTELEFADGTYAVRFAGEITDRGTFEIDETRDPKRLVLHGTAGPHAGRRVPGIYQLVGDRLRVCYGLDEVMPERFTTGHGHFRYLAVYRRPTEAATAHFPMN